MNILVKIVAVLAVIIGIPTVITGSKVLLGVFDPGYQYFTLLIVYNIIMGIISVITGALIWMKNRKALFYSYIITSAHALVFISLATIFSDIIASRSMEAMAFRFAAWAIISIIVWKSHKKDRLT